MIAAVVAVLALSASAFGETTKRATVDLEGGVSLRVFIRDSLGRVSSLNHPDGIPGMTLTGGGTEHWVFSDAGYASGHFNTDLEADDVDLDVVLCYPKWAPDEGVIDFRSQLFGPDSSEEFPQSEAIPLEHGGSGSVSIGSPLQGGADEGALCAERDLLGPTEPEGRRGTAAARQNHPPIAIKDGVIDARASAKAGAAVTIPVLQNDTDPDGDVLTLASPVKMLGPAACGFLRQSGIPPTAITLFPRKKRGCHGIVKFTYVATDGKLDSNPAVVEVEVRHFNRLPKPKKDMIKLLPARIKVSSTASHVVYGWRSKPFDVLANDKDADGDKLAIAGMKMEGALRRANGGEFGISCAPNGYCVVDYAPSSDLPQSLKALRADLHPPAGALASYLVSDGGGEVAKAKLRVAVDSRGPVYRKNPYKSFSPELQSYDCIAGDGCHLILGHGFLQKIVDNFSALQASYDAASQIWTGGPEPDECSFGVAVVSLPLGVLCEATKISLIAVVPAAVETAYRRLLLHDCARLDLTRGGDDLAGLLTPNAVDGEVVGEEVSVFFVSPRPSSLFSYACRPLSKETPKGSTLGPTGG